MFRLEEEEAISTLLVSMASAGILFKSCEGFSCLRARHVSPALLHLRMMFFQTNPPLRKTMIPRLINDPTNQIILRKLSVIDRKRTNKEK